MKIECRGSGINGGWEVYEGERALPIEEVKKAAQKLVQEAKDCVVVTIDSDGMPCAKAMFLAKSLDISRLWFSTNTSSRRVNQIKNNPTMTVYIYNSKTIEGLMLSGKAYVEEERKYREWLWDESSIEYYPGGIDDPDYCVMGFEARLADYYHGGYTTTFEVIPSEKTL